MNGEPWLETQAHAKVNLRLRIFPRGPDGYHAIETIFCRIDLADRIRLRLRRDPGIALRVSGPEPAPEGPDNLAARAAALLLERLGSAEGVEIELEKQVPAGAGLGGGSSDAAAVLRLLADRLPRRPTAELLMGLAGELGADVPFFLTDTPMALAWGRGDRLLSLPPVEARPMLVLLPERRVSTETAYTRWDESAAQRRAPAAGPFHTQWPALSSWPGLRELAENDFEPVIFTEHPGLGSLRGRLDESRPLLALLSGSGSALFAVYDTRQGRDVALKEMEAEKIGARLLTARGPV